ncbi:MAG: GntR family transcriptional regulator [Anaerolineae bacterium]
MLSLKEETPILQTVKDYRTKQELAYEALHEAIITCQFPPGKRLIENELAQQLGMSRSPVREALKRLQTEGLVEVIAHQGVIVADVALTSVHELYLILGALEGLACREASQRCGNDTLSQMATILERMGEAAINEEFAEWTRLNLEFHRVSRQDCGMPHLLRLIEDTWHRILRFHFYVGAAAQRSKDGVGEHETIYAAMKEQAGERIEQVVRAHYLNAAESFSRFLRALTEEEGD